MVDRVVILRDEVDSIVTSIRALSTKEVLIGIPESKTTRQTGGVTNADLGYIHEFGAPEANIPARPFLIPGVRKATNDALAHLRGAVLAALDGKADVALNELRAAGIIGMTYVKRELRTGNFVPLKPATVANRFRSRDTLSRRTNEDRYLQLVGWGTGQPGAMTPKDAQDATGIRPLINTAQLLASITYVVRQVKR